jgi:hypothetical protein
MSINVSTAPTPDPMAALAEGQGPTIVDGTPLPAGYPESYWRSLHYFNVYRMLVALVLLAGAVFGQATSHLGSYDRVLFLQVSAGYLSGRAGALMRNWRHRSSPTLYSL